MIKLSIFFSIFVTTLIISYLNLGIFLDTTTKPSHADILVCLGGGSKNERIATTVNLYKKGFSEKKIILLTGYSGTKKKGSCDNRILYLKKKNIPKNHIIIHQNLKNTVEEVLFIKRYMLKNKMRTALIITDIPHSRRVKLFFKLFSIKNDIPYHIKIIAGKDPNWNDALYYKKAISRQYALRELSKIVYGVFVYFPLYKTNLLFWYDKHFKRI